MIVTDKNPNPHAEKKESKACQCQSCILQLFFKSIFIVYSVLDFYILFMIFNYYSIVFRLVERFIHEPFGSRDWVTTPHVINDK